MLHSFKEFMYILLAIDNIQNVVMVVGYNKVTMIQWAKLNMKIIIILEFDSIVMVIGREEVDELDFYIYSYLLGPVEMAMINFGLNRFKILEVTFQFNNYSQFQVMIRLHHSYLSTWKMIIVKFKFVSIHHPC